MDEFNYSSTYSSGWRQIKREETENEQQKAVSLPQKELGAPIRFSKQLSEDASPNQKKGSRKHNIHAGFGGKPKGDYG